MGFLLILSHTYSPLRKVYRFVQSMYLLVTRVRSDTCSVGLEDSQHFPHRLHVSMGANTVHLSGDHRSHSIRGVLGVVSNATDYFGQSY